MTPHPLFRIIKYKQMTEKVSWLAPADTSEVQGPPFPPRHGPVVVGARLHFHEGDGELMALPMVPVDALGRRKMSMSDDPTCGLVPSKVKAQPFSSFFLLNVPVAWASTGTYRRSLPTAGSLCLAFRVLLHQSLELNFKIPTAQKHLGESNCVTAHPWGKAQVVCPGPGRFPGGWPSVLTLGKSQRVQGVTPSPSPTYGQVVSNGDR